MFKDTILEDIKTIFLNPEEFGEEHLIDGKKMTVTIDGIERLRREQLHSNNQVNEALSYHRLILYVSREDYGRMPQIGKLIQLDGISFEITDCIHEDGMYSISLERHKG